METVKQTKSVYALVTERIIRQLEKGVVPWRQSWATAGHPKNLITGERYRGVNVLLLSSLNFPQNLFLTYRQAAYMGANVKTGEKGNLVVFTKFIDEKTDEETKVRRYFLRYYMVFNVAQCEGIPDKFIPQAAPEKKPIEACEQIIKSMPKPPSLRFDRNDPFYNPTEDFINMPKLESFDSSESYYSVLFHELTHSTGHSSRLNRPEVMGDKYFGSEMYSREELTAEIGACFLKSLAGFKESVGDENTAYIKSWLKVLKNDSRFVVLASAQAQRAVDYIMNPKILDESHEPSID